MGFSGLLFIGQVQHYGELSRRWAWEPHQWGLWNNRSIGSCHTLKGSISKMPVSPDRTWIARWYQLSSEPHKLRHIEVGWELRGLREPWAGCFLPIYQSLLPHLPPNRLPREPLHFHCGQSRCLGNAQRQAEASPPEKTRALYSSKPKRGSLINSSTREETGRKG